MKSSKILMLNDLYVNLPEDFKGDLADALDYLAKIYRENQEVLESEYTIRPVGDAISNLEELLASEDLASGELGFLIYHQDSDWYRLISKDAFKII